LALARGLVEILPETTTGMQIGRTLMIFQTRDIVSRDFDVGQYIKNKNTEGKLQLEKDMKEANEKREKARKEMFKFKHGKNTKIEDRIKMCGLDEFNYEAYIK
jgi:hypothetical protein